MPLKPDRPPVPSFQEIVNRAKGEELLEVLELAETFPTNPAVWDRPGNQLPLPFPGVKIEEVESDE